MSSPTLAFPVAHDRPAWRRVAGLREIFAVDLRTLALFRIGLALLLLVDLGLRARDLTAHYTDLGVAPRAALIGSLNGGAFSFHLMNGTAWFQALLFGAAAVIALMLLLGYRTRLAMVLSWLFLLSLQNRNPMILSGEDNLIMLLAFWGLFLPLGARFSVDAALDSAERPAGNRHVSLAGAALLIQGMSMYLFSAILKSDAQWIPDGTAVHYALQLDYFVTPFALWLRQFDGLLRFLTYAVWTLELLGPLLIFSPLLHRPLRALCQAAFIAMHIGFFLCLEIGLFPFVSILMNLTFTQGWVWDRLGAALERPGAAGLRVYYDGGCDFCLKICRLLRTFLILPGLPIAPAQSEPRAAALMQAHDSWVVRDGAGRDHLGWEAMLTVLSASPLGRPLARLISGARARAAGERLYRLVAVRRGAWSRVTARLLPFRPVAAAPGLTANALAGVALVFVTAQNLTTLPDAPFRWPDQAVAVRQLFGLYQNWTMFAPHPEMNSPWPVIVGWLRDGSVVDVYNERLEPPSWAKPPLVSATYANYRWRRFLSTLEDQSYEDRHAFRSLYYARSLCRRWNRDTPAERRLAKLQIYFMVEWSPPDHRPKTPVTRLVWVHDCGE